MDNLVLISVVVALRRSLCGSTLKDVRQDSHHRFRLLFDDDRGARTLLVSLAPERPWIGTPATRRSGPGWRLEPFGAACRRQLVGQRLLELTKPAADRFVHLDFGPGGALVAELATHGANLVLCDAAGVVRGCARRPRSALDRISEGDAYRSPSVPPGLLDPFQTGPEAIQEVVDRALAAGEPPVDSIRRTLFGIGTHGARLSLDESLTRDEPLGQVLSRRLAAQVAGEQEPVVRFEDEGSRAGTLLPWLPDGARIDGRLLVAGRDAAQTASLHHEAIEDSAAVHRRWAAARSVLRAERKRVVRAHGRVSEELVSFADPERHRREGEALLAGIGHARRVGDAVWVLDPYAVDGSEVAIGVPAGQSLTTAAELRFRQDRKARRGLARSRARAEELEAQRARLDEIAADLPEEPDEAAIEQLEAQLRSAGLPVGLEPETRRGRALASVRRARLEGVRIFTSPTGATILVGKTARDNHRLTFRLASPGDFWFHARDRRGAHVVVRNPEQRRRPDPESLEEAAALAGWFSEGGRNESVVEVQWTLRKYVRKPRGAAPGTVVLKRFETIRVRPRSPDRTGTGAEQT